MINTTLHEKVTDHIRERIISGKIKAGDKLNEKVLSKKLGISRTPLREALRILSSEGLITLVPNRGAYVSKIPLDEIIEIFEAVSVLDGVCARKAAENMSEKDFKYLENLHLKMENELDKYNTTGYMRLNIKYHHYIHNLSGNQTINQIIDMFNKRIAQYGIHSANLPGRLAKSIQEHRKILEAFRDRNGERAERLIKSHLMNQCTAVIELSKTKQS